MGERVRSVTQNREGSQAACTDAISAWLGVPTGNGQHSSALRDACSGENTYKHLAPKNE